jgi:hypothetical protein
MEDLSIISVRRYRAKADEIRVAWKDKADPDLRLAMTQLADEYERMADDIEARARTATNGMPAPSLLAARRR